MAEAEGVGQHGGRDERGMEMEDDGAGDPDDEVHEDQQEDDCYGWAGQSTYIGDSFMICGCLLSDLLYERSFGVVHVALHSESLRILQADSFL